MSGGAGLQASFQRFGVVHAGQTTLGDYLASGEGCPYCPEHVENLTKHLVESHPAEVSTVISERAANTASTPDARPVTPDGGTLRVNPDGPAALDTVDTPSHNGQRLDTGDKRRCECTGCAGVQSSEGHAGRCDTIVSQRWYRLWDIEGRPLKCKHCEPRSQRFTQDPVYGADP